MVNQNGALDFYVNDEIKLSNLTHMTKTGTRNSTTVEFAGETRGGIHEQEEVIAPARPKDIRAVLALARKVELFPRIPQSNFTNVETYRSRSALTPATWMFIHGTPNCQ